MAYLNNVSLNVKVWFKIYLKTTTVLDPASLDLYEYVVSRSDGSEW